MKTREIFKFICLFVILLLLSTESIMASNTVEPQVISGDTHTGLLKGDGQTIFYGTGFHERILVEGNNKTLKSLAETYSDGLITDIRGGGILKNNSSFYYIDTVSNGVSGNIDGIKLTNTGAIRYWNNSRSGIELSLTAKDKVSKSSYYKTSTTRKSYFSENIKKVEVNDLYTFVLFESGWIAYTNAFNANTLDVPSSIPYWYLNLNSNDSIVDISALGNKLFAVDSNGDIIEMTTNASQFASIKHLDLKNIEKVSVGKEFLLALDENGKLFNKPLNLNKTTEEMYTPTNEINFFNSETTKMENPKIIDFSAGAWHFAALDEKGYVWTWGLNEKKELGRDLNSIFAVKSLDQNLILGKADISGENSVETINENENEISNPEGLVSDPIDTSTGAFVMNEKSVINYGGIYPFSVNLSYNSLLKTNYIETGLGLGLGYNSGWLFENSLVIKSENEDTIILLNEKFNKEILFKKEVNEEKFKAVNENSEYLFIEKENTKFNLSRKDGKTFVFNSIEEDHGTLHKIIKKNEYVEDFFYENGQLIKITQSLANLENSSRSFYFSYNEKFQLTSIKNDLNQEVLFSYEDKQDALEEKLVSIQYLNGAIEYFKYNEAGYINEIQLDNDTPYVKNEYDQHGRVVKQYDAKESISTFSYDEDSNLGKLLTTVTNREGQVEKFLYDENLNLLEKTNSLGIKTSFTYDSNRNKNSETNGLNQKTEITYNDNNQITKIKDHLNRKTDFAYDSNYNLISVTDPLENVTENEYNEHNQLVKITHPNGKINEFIYRDGFLVEEKVNNETIYTYEYDGFNLLKIKKPNGDFITHEKDILGRITKEVDAKGNETLFEYDNASNLVKTTDSLGNITEHTYDGYNQLVRTVDSKGIIDTYTYNGNGSLTSHKRHEQEVNYDYNKEEYVIKETSAKGSIFSKEYDAAGQLVKEIDAEGNVTTYKYDEIGKNIETNFEGEITKFEYDSSGNLAKKTLPNEAVYTYEYDTVNRLTKETNPKGHSTRYEYDLKGNLVKSIDANGKETNFTYDQNDNLVKTVDPKGNETLFEYNIYGQLIKTTNALGQSNQYIYDKNGNLIQSFDTLGNPEIYEYDSLNRLIETTDREGSSQTFKYDSLGNLTEVYDANNVKIKTYTYDQYGNVLKEQNTLGQEVESDYDLDNNLVKVINELNNQTKYIYNNNGEIIESIDSFNNPATVSYTEQGYTNSYSDTNENTTNYTYNKLGQIIKETNATGNFLTYNYDEIGNLTSAKNARNQESIYEYDAVGNVIKKSDENGVITYKYDDNYNLAEIKEVNGNKTSTVTRTYDELNRITSYTDTYGNKISYKYDAVGNMVEMIYPNNKSVLYNYDKVGNLLSVKDWNNNQTNYTYDKNHRLVKTENPNGTIETRTYDLQGQLTSLVSKKSNGEIISSDNFTYDATGNVIQENEENYTYDSLNRIISSNNNTYSYDAMGNILTASKTTELNTGGATTSDSASIEMTEGQVFEDVSTVVVENEIVGEIQNPIETVLETSNFQYGLDNRLTNFKEDNLTMDSDGNLTKVPLNGQNLQAVYDSRNRLTSIGETTYEYDMENNRISKVENGKETQFVYNTNSYLSELLMETDSEGNPTAYYIHGMGLVSKIAVEASKTGEAAEDTFFYHFDRRGSTVAMTDSQETVVNTYKYDVYGEVIEENETVDNSLQYNGQYGVYTDYNGLYFMRSRYYNPEIKRFINRDVIVGSYYESQSLNRFAYVNGNPISFIDPFGLERESDAKGKATWDKGMDVVQGVLGVVGFIPIFGEVADVTNGVISMGRGNYADAVANFASAIPIAGNGVAIGKVAYKAGDKISDINKAKKASFDCPKCFVAGTKILTKYGEKNIEDIEIGDIVLAKDENNPNSEVQYKRVLNLFERTANEGTITILVGNEKIETTAGHPFWVEGKGWIAADYLEVGDLLTTFVGEKLEIHDIIISEIPKTVYNFEVEDFHTYFVSSEGIWTHNKGKCIKEYEVNSKKLTEKEFNKLRQSAVKEAWKQEKEMILREGKGTRNWTEKELEELLKTGKVKGYEGQHMKSASTYPNQAGNPNNIQFLKGINMKPREHFDGAHRGNYQNQTNGYYDPVTGILYDAGDELPKIPQFDLNNKLKNIKK